MQKDEEYWNMEAAISKERGHMKWRDDWLNEITKTRVIDHDFRRLIANDRLFTCEKHFDLKDIEICK